MFSGDLVSLPSLSYIYSIQYFLYVVKCFGEIGQIGRFLVSLVVPFSTVFVIEKPSRILRELLGIPVVIFR